MDIRVGIITGYGINADYELAEAFNLAGASSRRIHINDIIEDPALLGKFHILGFPGGFSFGDHIASGLVFANLCRKHLLPAFKDFIVSGGLIIGICNGFQVLVKMGMLPNINGTWEQEVSLVHNDSGLFIDAWVETTAEGDSVWTDGIGVIDLPVRHGEGKFIPADRALLDRLESEGMVALRYTGKNPNGSMNGIAGITDESGRIFGLMPHPEAYLIPQNHPSWTGMKGDETTGLGFFRNAVDYARNNLNI